MFEALIACSATADNSVGGAVLRRRHVEYCGDAYERRNTEKELRSMSRK
jgi:hypothetical protein